MVTHPTVSLKRYNYVCCSDETFLRFSGISEAFASEFRENIEEMFLRYS